MLMDAHVNLAIDLDEDDVGSDAADYVNASLRRIGMRRPAQQAGAASPTLQLVINRLGYYLSDAPVNRFTGKPLIDSTLEAGLIAFFSASALSESGATRFFQASISRATELLSMQIRCGVEAWDPMDIVPLGNWLSSRPSYSVLHHDYLSRADLPTFRRHVLSLISTTSELARLGADPVLSIQSPR